MYSCSLQYESTQCCVCVSMNPLFLRSLIRPFERMWLEHLGICVQIVFFFSSLGSISFPKKLTFKRKLPNSSTCYVVLPHSSCCYGANAYTNVRWYPCNAEIADQVAGNGMAKLLVTFSLTHNQITQLCDDILEFITFSRTAGDGSPPPPPPHAHGPGVCQIRL